MTEKLTPEEIIKALEISSVALMYGEEVSLYKLALDLINRQQAEIERLQNDLAISKKETKRYATRRAEEDMIMTSHLAILKGKERQSIEEKAIKEFAERLKEKGRYATPYISLADIYDLVKEMVGEDK